MIALCLTVLLTAPLAAEPAAPDVQDEMKQRLRALKEGDDAVPLLRAMRGDCKRTDDDPKEVKKYVSRFLRNHPELGSAAYCALLGTQALELELVGRDEVLVLAGSDRPALLETGLWMLGILRDDSAQAGGLLETALSDPSPAIRKTSAWALSVAAADNPATDLIPGSDTEPEGDIARAEPGPFRDYVSRVGRPLSSDGLVDPELWGGALESDGMMGSFAHERDTRPAPGRVAAALPRIAQLLADEDREVRRTALWALMWAAAEAGPFVGTLTELLDDPDPLIVTATLRAFSKMGAAAGPAAERLRLFAKGTPEQRELALLARIRAGVELPVSELVEYLAAERPMIVVVATQELARRTPPPPDAFSPLSDSFLALNYFAARALVRYGERGLPPLVEALETGPLDLRGVAIVALGELGPVAAPTRSRLEAVVAAGEQDEADAGARALASAARRSLALIDG